ncbi:nucleotide sugar dehydrogenase [Cryobacterium frigoriphilum]|uniref:Nucleotide sugar dehydrogenase n=1 Tax=Cryobacterium frigoriphilum TaxID=1259150 RepID=A0A4R9A2B4_9MICO|nr:nucleotide sugar dehydrogenase [Cryobacterium frigoriphilum]TFD50796.1 nucleotide sugar dehydrogenase [Cryobacterium frigoriphilum]
MHIAVIALGKIGLPLAVQFAEQGHQVIGVDVNERTVGQINAGTEPFPGEAHLQAKLTALVADGRLRATTDYREAVTGADVVVVVVPLFVDDDARPDFEWMDAATRSLGSCLTPGALVLYETTLPVGTTRTRWKPMLEAVSGLTEGVDFDLAFSPERVLTGRIFADLRKYPKIVGGLSPAGTARAVAFYESVLDFDPRPDLSRPNGVWDVGSAEAAELTKLAETTYRDVNIGLANQFARYAATTGIDVYEVITAANSQPFSHIHQPGIAVGGHCIPVYPRLYLWNDPDATVVRAAREANAAMPEYSAALLEREHGPLAGATILILGAAYRGGVKETAFSGVFPTRDSLAARGARVVVHDPLYRDDELVALGLSPYHLGEPVDAAIVQADHAEYRTLTPADLPGIRTLLDGRRLTDPELWTGITHAVIGRP